MDISRIPGFDAQTAINGSSVSAKNQQLAESFLEQFNSLTSSDDSEENSFANENVLQQNNEDQIVDELQEKFRQFVGNTLYGQMLKSMRNTVGKPAYMHGGRTEEVFQQQLDQIMVEDLTKKSAATIADPMFELFNNQRRS